MKSTTIRRSGLAALALTMSLGMAACGSSDDSSSSSTPKSDTTSSSPSPSETSSSAAAGSEPFGSACSAVPASGAGSFQGMSTAPVATAASANPVLSTLVAAVKAAGLVDTLNNAPEITVFAPANDAFKKIPSKDLNALLANKAELTKVLTHHVVEGKIAPDQLAGEHKTLNGDTVNVEGSGEQFTVGSDKANVICGNVQTANATVYIIDSVLTPGK
jgi:uncharacterized surface protein with fasciclin (FAS1) repeats